jgi:hypothetical protein
MRRLSPQFVYYRSDSSLDRAMNTIIASRAGKDLISSLCSGLLTIGSRFGAALDEAAAMFSNARDTGLTPREFVDQARKQNKLSEFSLPTRCGCALFLNADFLQLLVSGIRSRV